MKHLISLFLRFVPRKHLQRFSHVAAKMMSIFYLGNKVECTVCGRHYSSFLPYGRVRTRKNALCPNCLALERHRLMWLYLQEKTNFLTDNLKVLHVAPELCFLKKFDALDNLDYITADLESPWAKVHFDVHEIPFEDDTFDVVICNHLLEHVEDDRKSLKELYRVMKPGGWGIMQSPINPSREVTDEDRSLKTPKEREEKYGQNDHLRDFGLDYPERLKAGGFKVVVDEFVKSLPEEKIKRHALLTGGSLTVNDFIYRVEK